MPTAQVLIRGSGGIYVAPPPYWFSYLKLRCDIQDENWATICPLASWSIQTYQPLSKAGWLMRSVSVLLAFRSITTLKINIAYLYIHIQQFPSGIPHVCLYKISLMTSPWSREQWVLGWIPPWKLRWRSCWGNLGHPHTPGAGPQTETWTQKAHTNIAITFASKPAIG